MVAGKLTVLQILPALQSGGVERGTLEIAQHLVAQGHRSLVMSAGGRMVSALEAAGSTHFTARIGKKSLLTLLQVKQLRALWQREGVDIVHVRSRFPAWVVYLAWKGLPQAQRPRLVTTVHGYYRPGWYSRIMTCGERVIVISRGIQNAVQHHYGLPAERMQLIYRGVDTAQYHPDFRASQAWQNDWFAQFPHTRNQRWLVLPARISRWKGAEDFIDLVKLVCEQQPDVHALLVGEVADDKHAFAEHLQQKIRQAHLSHRVTLVGYRSDIKEILSMATIVYSLSLAPEAFGRTTLEALSLGVPVIGYAHGGVAEQLAAMLPEGAVAVGNVAEAAMLTLSWLQHPPQVQLNTQFLLSVMQARTLAVYEGLHAERGAR